MFRSDMMGGQLLPGPLLHVFPGSAQRGRHNSMPDSAGTWCPPGRIRVGSIHR